MLDPKGVNPCWTRRVSIHVGPERCESMLDANGVNPCWIEGCESVLDSEGVHPAQLRSESRRRTRGLEVHLDRKEQDAAHLDGEARPYG
eukprot:5229448-Prymnesium_polylepis.1